MEALIAIALLCGQPTKSIYSVVTTDDVRKQDCQVRVIECINKKPFLDYRNVSSCYLDYIKK